MDYRRQILMLKITKCYEAESFIRRYIPCIYCNMKFHRCFRVSLFGSTRLHTTAWTLSRTHSERTRRASCWYWTHTASPFVCPYGTMRHHLTDLRKISYLEFFYVRKGCTGTGVGVEGFVSLSQVLFWQHVSTYGVIFRSYIFRKAVSL